MAQKEDPNGEPSPKPGGSEEQEQPKIEDLSDKMKSLAGRIGVKRKNWEKRREAKKQERSYVEQRKKELLAGTRVLGKGNMGIDYSKTGSLTKVGKYIESDDPFPAMKMGEGMDFGLYKARLLTKKPNGKYAMWTGKQPGEGHYMGLDIDDYLKKFREAERVNFEDCEEVLRGNERQLVKTKRERPEVDPEKDLKGIKHGNFEQFPLDEDGDPLWTSESDEDTVKDEDDSLISLETLAQAIKTPALLNFERSRQKYGCFTAETRDLMQQKPDKDEVIRNTLRSVIRLQKSGREPPPKTQSDRARSQIHWEEEIFVYKYYREDVPCNLLPTKERRRLKNIVKEEKKKKEQP